MNQCNCHTTVVWRQYVYQHQCCTARASHSFLFIYKILSNARYVKALILFISSMSHHVFLPCIANIHNKFIISFSHSYHSLCSFVTKLLFKDLSKWNKIYNTFNPLPPRANYLVKEFCLNCCKHTQRKHNSLKKC
jgi:hypothetical protein